jgi:hypothetical protein
MNRWLAWRSGGVFAALVLIAGGPTIAHACASCTGGDGPRAQTAFLGATVFMTLLPLGLIGAGILWLKRGGREWLAREFDDRDAWTPSKDPKTAVDSAPVAPAPAARP